MADERKEVKIWLEPDDHARLEKLAKYNKRSMRSEVYYRILVGLREHETPALPSTGFRPAAAQVTQYDLEAE